MTHLVTTHIAIWCLGVSMSSYHELFPMCEATYSVMTHIALSLEYPHTSREREYVKECVYECAYECVYECAYVVIQQSARICVTRALVYL